jgi:hypothetical protein
MRFRLLALAALSLPALAAPAGATTSTVRVGIADQYPAMFGHSQWQRLDLERTRYVIRWNAADDPGELQRADAFVDAARDAGVDVLLHISTDNYTPREAELPSRSAYRRKVGELVDRYHDKGVREFGVWNEANDRTQPTYRSPARAAQFFQELWRMLDDRDRCGADVAKRCRVVALDLLDGRTKALQASVRSYVRRFFAELGPTYDRRADFIGIHNYSDTNRESRTGTRNAIDAVRRYNGAANFWLTETGGIVKLGETGDFACDPSSAASRASSERQARGAVRWMFRLAKDYRRHIDRLYVYQWSGSDCRTRFDAGLVRLDGSKRPAWYDVYRQLRDSKILKP